MHLKETVGREREIELLLRNIQQRQHTLIFGRNGVGKTHLLLAIQRRLRETGSHVFYLKKPTPTREAGHNVYTWLLSVAGDPIGALPKSGPENRTLERILSNLTDLLADLRVANQRLVLLIDEVDQMHANGIPLFDLLAERLILVAAGRARSKGARFNRFFWRFEELPLKPMPVDQARRLVELALEQAPDVRIVDERARAFLINRMAEQSNGIPAAVVESVTRLRGAEQIDHEFVRQMFVHRASQSFFDATPLLLTFFAFLVVMRFINRGMYQFDMYAIFGAMSGLMLIARWFMFKTSREARLN